MLPLLSLLSGVTKHLDAISEGNHSIPGKEIPTISKIGIVIFRARPNNS